MFNRTHLLIVCVAVLGALLGLFAGSHFDLAPRRALPASVNVLKRGDTRRDLALPDADGALRHLSDWNGRFVLVNFWATWCGPCRDEMPLLDRTRAKFAAQGLEVVGIAIDDDDAVRRFLAENPVRYPILIGAGLDPDPSLEFGDTRSVLPYSVLIGRDGKILEQRAGSFSEDGLARWLAPHL